MKYLIPECNIESLEKKLTKIRNKCAKYGCEFKYERIGEEVKKVKFEGVEQLVKFIEVEVEGTAAVNGWQFAASLDFTEKGNVIQSVGNLEIPHRYYECSPWCEHCKTARDRKHSFIVYNSESGEFKQVGRACLKDFTGGLSAENVANFESYFKECEEASEFTGFGYWTTRYFDVVGFMAVASEMVRLYGYVKSEYGFCTRDRTELVYLVQNGYGLGMRKEFGQELYDDAIEKGLDVERGKVHAKEVIDWILNNERDDNYFHNMKVACALEYVSSDKLGLLVSAFPSYDRNLEYEAEKKAREEKEALARAHSSWMGDVGDKVSFKIADFRVISSWGTQWGTTAVFKFVDEEGREATWKTSNWYDDGVIGKVLSGKVKELKEFRGIKQTELTRCKIA